VERPGTAAYSAFHALRHPPGAHKTPEPIMQSRLLNSRIESHLTLVVGLLSVAVIAAGTLGMGRTFDPSANAGVAVVHLEPVVITSSKRAPAKVAQAAEVAAPSLN
jgi:hypothetical protein